MNLYLRSSLPLLVVLSVLLFIPLHASADTFEIRFRNTTNQVLTSPVCAIHGRRASIFTNGEEAPDGLKELAEDGVSGSYARTLRNTQGVRSVAVGDFTTAKSRSTLEISSNKGRRISCVVGMLVATNDGFPAFRGLRLPKQVGESRRIRARVYDAGTEVNTESCDHVPGGPCDAHFVGIEENGTVQLHPGLMGEGDLNAERLGWKTIAVRGRITRID